MKRVLYLFAVMLLSMNLVSCFLFDIYDDWNSLSIEYTGPSEFTSDSPVAVLATLNSPGVSIADYTMDKAKYEAQDYIETNSNYGWLDIWDIKKGTYDLVVFIDTNGNGSLDTDEYYFITEDLSIEGEIEYSINQNGWIKK